jgi:glutamine synthetase
MKYMSLDQRGHVQAEYVWIDAVGNCRCKTKVCNFFPPFESNPILRVTWKCDCGHGFHVNGCAIWRRDEYMDIAGYDRWDAGLAK